MGIPYSREINAAFEQVTPLVAAGFVVLRTTKNISILLAVIQVLTVLFLALILFVLLGILYSINPDLEEERKQIVTPFYRWLSGVSLLGVLESIVAVGVGFAGFVSVGLFFLWGRERNDVEGEGNEDAGKALEDLEGDNKTKRKKGRGNGAKKGANEAGKEESKTK